ncbi:stress up-regulated Nod 19 protein [Trifolium repens]|nr:stress up-regulated Nod 19 protein [Trifolium repens]
MLRDMSVLDGICPYYITGDISLGLLMNMTEKLHGHAELSQYEILDLFERKSKILNSAAFWYLDFPSDVTDTLQPSDDSKGLDLYHDSQVEYQVESCSTEQKEGNDCVHVKRTSLPMQTGGYVIYGVAHQHSGGIGSTLYRQDGRIICSSVPIYGNGNEAGNEPGYVVGMSTCYPQLG